MEVDAQVVRNSGIEGGIDGGGVGASVGNIHSTPSVDTASIDRASVRSIVTTNFNNVNATTMATGAVAASTTPTSSMGADADTDRCCAQSMPFLSPPPSQTPSRLLAREREPQPPSAPLEEPRAVAECATTSASRDSDAHAA
eukprot:5813601-Pleurochrysis_carterae.AAC.1